MNKLIIELEDVEKHLSKFYKDRLEEILSLIRFGRMQEGKDVENLTLAKPVDTQAATETKVDQAETTQSEATQTDNTQAENAQADNVEQPQETDTKSQDA